MSETNTLDGVVRAMCVDGTFRVITLRTTDLVAQAVRAQEVTGTSAQWFGELLTGSVLVRETMSPGHRVQLTVKAPRHGSLAADTHPKGMTRGICKLREPLGDDGLGDGALLQVSRTQHSGTIHQGIVQAAGSISETLMGYMQQSEQIYSVIDVACLMGQGRVLAAGGYIVQVLPELTATALERMIARLLLLPSASLLLRETASDPGVLMARLLQDFEHEVIEKSGVHYGCNCSLVRVMGALATLGKGEIQNLVAEGEAFEMGCDYCGSSYEIGTEQLRSLLDPS